VSGELFEGFLRQRAKKLGLTLSGLAEKSGVSRQALYKLLRGNIRDAQLSTLIRLAKALELHPIALMREILESEISPPPSSQKSKYPGDYSGFISDVTIPDNTVVMAGSVFGKIWKIQNLGSVDWENRRLVCIDDEILLFRKHGDNLIPLERNYLMPLSREVPIATTRPGEPVEISVTFRAPNLPCTTISYWKMMDEEGDYCFPQLEGVWCKVHVVAI
jgi:transcriptional regulator with XRE-family HTH domain